MKNFEKRILSLLCAAVMLLSIVALPNLNVQATEAGGTLADELATMEAAGHLYANYVAANFDAGTGTVVADDEAYTKNAISSTVKDLTGAGKFMLYRYCANADADKQYYKIAELSANDLKLNQGYQIYKFSVDVPATGMGTGGLTYFFDDNWEMIHAGVGTVIGNFAGKKLDLYLSIKITGTANAATLYIDRFAVVDPCTNHMSEDGTTCTTCGKVFGEETPTEPEASVIATFTADNFYRPYGDPIVTDTSSAQGKAAEYSYAKRYATGDAGLYNAMIRNGEQILGMYTNAMASVGEITIAQLQENAACGQYVTYKFSGADLSGASFIYLFDCWGFQVPLTNYSDALQGQLVDVHLSMKVTGDVTSTEGNTPVYYIDKVVIAQAGAAVEPDPTEPEDTEPEASLIATFMADNFYRPYGDPIVTDTSSAQGKAAEYSYAKRYATGDAGLYNAMIRNGEQILGMYTNAMASVGEITIAQLQENAACGQYVTYKFSGADLSGASFIYLFDCWGFQVPLTNYSDALQGQLVDVYLSMKVTGDVTSTEGNTPVYYIDKVVIAEAGAAVEPDSTDPTEPTEPTEPEVTEPQPTEPAEPVKVHYVFTADNFEMPYAPGNGDCVADDATSAQGKAAVYSYEKRAATGDKNMMSAMLRIGAQKLILYTYGGIPAESRPVGELTIAQLQENAAGGQYVEYVFKNVNLIPTKDNYFLYLFDCWGFKLNLSAEQKSEIYNTGLVDVILSMKVTGDVTDKNNPPTYYIDKLEIKTAESGEDFHRHEYGEWIIDEVSHSATCSGCGEILNELHIWDNGIVTKEPADGEKGERVYTCGICKGTKTEEFDERLRYVFPADKLLLAYAPDSGDCVIADSSSPTGTAAVFSYNKRAATGDKGLADSMLRVGDQRFSIYTYGGNPAESRLIGELASSNLRENAKGGKYVTYKFKNVKVVPGSGNYFMYLFDCWGCQLRFTNEQKAALQGQRVDVFLTMKVTGDVTSKTNPPTYYIAKIVIQETSSEGDNLIPYVPKAETAEPVVAKGVPTELPAEFKAENFTLPYAELNNGDTIVEDASSAHGKAAMLSYEKRNSFGDKNMVAAMIRSGDQKLAMYTDSGVLVGEISIAELKTNSEGGKYVTYNFKNVSLAGAKFLYLFDCWGFQVPLTGLADKLTDKKVDVALSLKVTGDVTSKEGNTPAYYIESVIITEAVPVEAHEHIYEQWITDVLNHTSTCTVCGMKLEGSHSWDAGVVIKEATETEDGEMLYTCKVCQMQETKRIRKQASPVMNNNTEGLENFNTMIWVAAGLVVVAVVIVVVLLLAKKPGKKE